jgi:hypothetical protein
MIDIGYCRNEWSGLQATRPLLVRAGWPAIQNNRRISMSYSSKYNSDHFIKGSIELIPIRTISPENIKAVKSNNDAALRALQAVMGELNQLDPTSLEPIRGKISEVNVRIGQARLFIENFRRSVETIKQFIQRNDDLQQNPYRKTVLAHLNEALVHSEEIDYKLCPLNNDEQLYSPEMGVTIDEILKHIPAK